jgi:hypothetical protein
MEEIDFTLMSNIAEEVEREYDGLLPFTEMVNIMLTKYYATIPTSVHKCYICDVEDCTESQKMYICKQCANGIVEAVADYIRPTESRSK